MAVRGGIIRRSAILLVKSETTPGTDAAPTVAANALVAYEVEMNPRANASVFERKPIVGDAQLGNQTPVSGIVSATISFKVPVCGSGTAGTAPDYGAALKACGTSETIVGATSVTYKLTATATTATIWFYAGPAADLASPSANWKLYKMRGCIGNAKYVVGGNGEPAMWEFEFQGTYVTPVDVSDPGDPTLLEVVPEPILAAGLSWTKDGGSTHAPRFKSMTFDFGNNVVARKDLNQTSGIVAFIMEDRTPNVTMQIEEELASSSANWWDTAEDNDFGVLEIGPIGSAGNIHAVSFARASLKSVSMTEADGVISLDTEWTPAINVASLSTAAATITFT